MGVPLQGRSRTTDARVRPPQRASAVSSLKTPSAGCGGEAPRARRTGGHRCRGRWSCDRLLLLGAGVEPATDDLSGRCSTRLSYPVEAIPESNRALLLCEPSMAGLRRFWGDAAWTAPTGTKPGCRPPAGFTNPWPVSVAFSRQMRGRLALQLRRDPRREERGRRAASHSCTSARMCRPSSRNASKRLGT